MADIGRAATIDPPPTADPCGLPPSLDGLITFLSWQCGENVYDWELIEITGSRNCQAVNNAIDLDHDSVLSQPIRFRSQFTSISKQ
jgi:hypothetical protein